MAQDPISDDFRRDFGIEASRTAIELVNTMREAYESRVVEAFHSEPQDVQDQVNLNALAAHFALTALHLALTSVRETITDMIGPEGAFQFEAEVSDRVAALNEQSR